MRPIQKDLFSRIAAFFYSQNFLNEIRMSIAPQPGLKILDAACGTGALYDICMPCLYYGLDIDENRIMDCIQNFPEGHFCVADASKTNFPDAFFDIVLAAGLFHHVDDQLANEILKEFKRLLKKSGKIIVIDAIWPSNIFNVVGWIGRKMDQGDFVRHSNEYVDIFSKHFEIANHSFNATFGLEYIIAELRKGNAQNREKK